MLRWLPVASNVQPSIGCIRLRVAFQVEYFYDAIPDRFPVEYFLNWHALTVRSLSAM